MPAQVRHADPSLAHFWPEESETRLFRDRATSFLESIQRIGHMFVRIAGHYVRLLDEEVADLWEGSETDPVRGISQTNLSLFHYGLEDGFLRDGVHCPYHTDIGMVTIIPHCAHNAAGGLHVFDYATGSWVDLEGPGAPPGYACQTGRR